MAQGPDEVFPCTVLRLPGDAAPLEAVVADHAEDLVRILYLDRSQLSFKQRVIDEELARDFCLRNGAKMYAVESTSIWKPTPRVSSRRWVP